MLLFMESFDHEADKADLGRKWDFANIYSISSDGRNGKCAKLVSSDKLRKILPANYATLIFGAAFYFTTDNAERYLFSFRDGTAIQVSVKWLGPSHKLRVYRGNTLLGTTTRTFPLNTWMYLEFKATIDQVAGAYELRVAGVNVLSAAGIRTQETANPYANDLNVGASYMDGHEGRVDDLYLCDDSGTLNNDFLGDIKVEVILPNGPGHYSQWTPSAGLNYECVDEAAPNDDTDYVSSATVGQKDSYACQDITLTGSIKGIQILALERKDDAGNYTTRLLTRSGGGDYFGDNFIVFDTYRYDRQIREIDPATGLPWTVPGINAFEPGVEVVS